jgi:hypothetical protein
MNRFEHRKQEILQSVQAEARAAAGRRQALRASGAVACTGAALIAVVAALTPNPTPQRSSPHAAEQAPPPPPSKLDVRITSRRAVLSDYAMSDAELLSALEDTGEPVGVIWHPEAPRVVSFASRDAEPNGG